MYGLDHENICCITTVRNLAEKNICGPLNGAHTSTYSTCVHASLDINEEGHTLANCGVWLKVKVG